MRFAEGSRVLLVGEGDFSFAASLATEGQCAAVHLTATSLQQEPSARAQNSIESLTQRGIRVVLGVDATCLHTHPDIRRHKYTHVIFNFPHVGGKMRIDLNRKLLRDFFHSAVDVLEADGSVVVTLCGGQGGVPLDPTFRRWDDTWKAVLMASYANLVVRYVRTFDPSAYPGYSPTGYRSLDKGFCQDGALTFVFRVCEVSVGSVGAEATESVLTCDGSTLSLPSFLHSQIQRDIISDTSLLVGHLYDRLVELLGGNLTVHRLDKLVFRAETQHASLKKCETVTTCASLKGHVFCHPSYRINSEQGLSVEPLVILFSSGNTDMASVLSQTITLCVRNVSQTFIPEVKKLTFGDFTEDQMCFGDEDEAGCEGYVTCHIINVTSLAGYCGDVAEDEMWADGQTVNIRNDVLTYSPFSLFPCHYTYDLSFWDAGTSDATMICEAKQRSRIDTIITNIGRDVVKSYRVLSTYEHTQVERRSHTYRIVYRSWRGALSDQRAKEIHSLIGYQLDRCLGVEIR